MEAWHPGSRFGELEIERELGRGTFGAVLLARDTLVGRRVALKILRLPGSASPDERAALLREAQLVGRLRSAHVATLYRVHQMPDGWAFELEYIDGGSLEDRLAREPRLPLHEAGRIAQGILKGLGDAHAQGIVHGDIKPGNVLLGNDGSVKLVDFGLAHLIGELSLRVPRDEVVGTPAYMAPEVIMGEQPAPASDLWSFGVVLYRMLAGRHPFPGRSLPALFHAIQNAAAPPLDAQLPPHLADLATHCLAQVPRDRPASCADALQALLPAAVAEPRHAAPHPERARPRLFGRAAERGRLHAAAARAASGLGTTVLLLGDLGMGKSSLASDLGAHAEAIGFRCVEARVTAIDGLLRPLIAALRDLAARPAHGGKLGEIESRLFGTATGLLRTLLEGTGPVPVESRQQVAWGLEELLVGLSAERPLGLLVDDAHLANADDWRLVSDLTRRVRQLPVLLCIASSTDDASPPPLADAGAIEEIRLRPLDADAVARLLQAGAGVRLQPEVLRRVLDASEGNPLFAIELFRHLRETNAIRQEGDLLVPGAGFAKAPLPHRLRELALARLAGLPEDHRALLDIAAVDGLAFDGEGVAAVADRPLLDVLRTLQEIYRRTGLIVPRKDGYRFAHAVLQEAISEELAPPLRRALHARLAGILEERAARASVAPARLALHWEGAEEEARARPHFVRAAQEALRRQEHLRALDFVRRAGLSSERLDPETAARHADLLLDLVVSHRDLGRPQDSERIYELLERAAGATGDTELGLKVRILRAATHYDARGLAGLDLAGLTDAAERVSTPVYKGRACYVLGRIAKYRGDLEDAERRFLEADAIFVRTGELGRHSSALDQLGSVALRRGRWHHAEALYADSARISAMVGRPTNAAISQVNGALASLSRGKVEGIEQRLAEAIRTFSLEGAELHEAFTRVHVATVRYAAGDRKGAESCLAEALPTLRKSRFLRGLIAAVLERAHFAAVAGSLDVARQGLEEAKRLAELAEDDVSRLATTCHACHVACFLGDRGGAVASARAAIDTARRIGEVAPRANALLGISEAVVYGLPWPAARDAHPLVAATAPDDADVLAVPTALHEAVASLADSGADVGPMEKSAAALRSDRVGYRRAALRVVADLLEAESARRRGDAAAATRAADAGIAAAAALGHVWLEARLLRLRGELPGGASRRERLRDLLRPVADGVAPAERPLLLEAWGACA
ncbi:MAG TPA: protein kinase [Planctomycetota bacterium]|nr:protein kinase [Planctomycetota bacterium]